MIALSVIVTTYNWPEALARVLYALEAQTHKSFELVIADDGSRDATKALINQWQAKASFPIHHVWQEDKGFRAAKIRNKSVAKAKGDYLIFIDGDCVLPKNFIKNHAQLAEQGFFVVGNRILLSQDYTNQVMAQQLPIHQYTCLQWRALAKQKHCNRWWPVCRFPLGFLRKLFKKSWKSAKTCNLGVWKQDFLNNQGFNEQFEGWGYEDSDLVIRLIRAKVFRKSGRFSASVFHLWHPENTRAQSQENKLRLKQLLEGTTG